MPKGKIGIPRFRAPTPVTRPAVKKGREKGQSGLVFKKLKKGVCWQWWKNGLCVCQSTVNYRTSAGAAKGFDAVLRHMNNRDLIG